MLGLTHALSGAAAGLAVGALAASPIAGLACGVVGAAAAYGPDIDHAGSTASKTLGPVSGWIRRTKRKLGLRHRGMPLLCRGARALSRAVGLPAHRGITHTVAVAVAVGFVVGLVAALVLPVPVACLFGVAALVGWLAALAGDWVTRTSLPHLWWPWLLETPGPPKWMRISTGKWAEKWLVLPAVTVATLLGAALVLGLTLPGGASHG